MKSNRQRNEEHRARVNAKRAAKGKPPIPATFREAMNQDRETRQASRTLHEGETALTGLSVRITTGGQVFKGSLFGHALGPLAGSHAEIGIPSNTHRVAAGVTAGALIGPVGLLAAASTKTRTAAYIVFPDGTVHTTQVQGKGLARRMLEQDVLRYNALVAARQIQDSL